MDTLSLCYCSMCVRAMCNILFASDFGMEYMAVPEERVERYLTTLLFKKYNINGVFNMHDVLHI